jgi:MFS family permease
MAKEPMVSKPPTPVHTELGRHLWRILVLGSIGMFMGTLVTTVVAVALPVMGPALRLTYSEALWIQAAYVITMCVFLIPVGRLADRHGLLRFYLLGLGIFAVFSVACALAFSGPFLIVMRCLQGMGAAFTAASAPALITTVFPPEWRGRGLGLNAMAGYLGLMAGPPIGGLIATHTSWRWIFLINVPLALGTLANGWFLLGAEGRDRAAALAGRVAAGVAAEAAAPRPAASPGSAAEVARPTTSAVDVGPGGAAFGRRGLGLDWPGTILLAFFLVCLLIPLISVPFWGWRSPTTLGLLGAFVVLLGFFLVTESRVRDPLLDLALVGKNRVFAASTFTAFLNYAAIYGVTTLTAVFLELSEGFTPQHAGLLLLVQPAFMTALSPAFGRLSDRIGSRPPVAAGMLLTACGTTQLGLLPAPAPAWRVVLALATVGLGMAAFSAPNTSAVMGAVKKSELSLASGFLGTMRTAGQAVSIALLGAIAASGLGPTGGRVLFLGEKASEAAAASFADGYQTAMLVAAGLSVVGALVSLARGPRPAENSR